MGIIGTNVGSKLIIALSNSKFRHHYIKGTARVEQDPPQEQLHLESALTYAQEKNLERHAVTDERELMRDALKRSMGEASFAEILELSRFPNSRAILSRLCCIYGR